MATKTKTSSRKAQAVTKRLAKEDRRTARTAPNGQKEEKKDVQYRIGWVYGSAILGGFFIYDIWELVIDAIGTASSVVGVGVLLWALNWVTWVGAIFVFWLVFAIQGVFLFKSPKKIVVTSTVWIVELIPGLDTAIITAFGWTIGVLIIILIARSEDKGGALAKVTSLKNPKRAGKQVSNVGKR